MDRCELCQALLLEYVYDLVEGEERQSLEAHLADCAKCQAALVKAQQQQRLLAAAAKAEFAGVRFQAPATANPSPATIPVTVRKVRPHYGRWAMAAAILLAVAGLGSAGAWLHHDYTLAQGVIKDQQAVFADVRGKAAEAKRQVDHLPLARQEKIEALDRKLREQQLEVMVIGPQSVPAGLSSDYRVTSTDLNGKPVPTRLTARVISQDRRIVFEKALNESASEHRLEFPPTLPVLPNSKLMLEVVAKKDGGPVGELHQELDLIAPVYVTHLATDKPMYQPGETIHYRSLTLERFSLKPVQEPLQIVYTLLDPSGAQIPLGAGSPLVNKQDTRTGAVTQLLGPDKKPIRGIGAGDALIPLNAAGGEYTLRVSEALNRFPAQDRKFVVNRYQPHRLNKKLDFGKKSYGPGENASAACEVTRAEGGTPVANRPVEITVKIDGQTYGPDGQAINQPVSYRTQTDAQGKVVVRFKLPAVIKTGDGTLSVLFDDGGSREPLVKPIPIVLKKLDVEFYPEGGELIAGVPNRVYFQVRNTRGKPADLTGHLIDADQKTVVKDIHTLTDAQEPGVNQGLGVFAFTPKVGGKYELKIDAPAGMEGKYVLPEVKADGVVLSIPRGVTTATEPIQTLVRSAKQDRTLLVGAYCRGRLLDYQRVTVKEGQEKKVALNPAAGAGGVYRITVFEEHDVDGNRGNRTTHSPVAERLVYRQPAEELHITVKSDKSVYVPGDKAKLSFSALNEQEKLTPAILMVGVVDKSVVTMADEKTHRAMPTHFLMTCEVKKPEDLEYADFLIGSHPKAAAALDLLLGTQGWRHFTEKEPTKSKDRPADDAERMLVSISQSELPRDFREKEVKKVDEETKVELAQLQERRQEAQHRLEQEHINAAYLAALAKLTHYDEWIQKGRQIGIPLLCLVLMVVAIIALIAGIVSKVKRAVPYYVASVACAALVCVLAVNYWEAGVQLRPRSGTVAYSEREPEVERLGDRLDRRADQAQFARDLARPAMEAAPKGAPERAEAFGMKPNAPADAAKLPAPEGAAALGAIAPANRDLDKAKEELGRPHAAKKLADEGMDQLMEKEAKQLDAKAKNAVGKGDGKERMELKRGGIPPQGWAGNNNGNNAGNNNGANNGFGGLQGGFGGMQGAAGLQLGQVPGGGPAAGFQPPGGMGPAAPAAAGRPGAPGVGGGAARKPMGREAGDDRAKDAQFRRLRTVQEQSQMIQLPPFVVREYAHFHAQTSGGDRRSDASETVYWNPVLVLPDGKAEASFELSDQVTTFQVTAYGHTLDGRLGAVTSFIESRLPLTLAAKTPIEVTANDIIGIPLAVANNTPEARSVQIDAKILKGLRMLQGQATDQLNLTADKRTRRIYRFQPTILEGQAELLFTGESKPFAADNLPAAFKVVPDGFPVLASKSDLLEKSATNEVVLPETWIKGTLKLQMSVYPSTLADLQKGLDSLLREPNGCFEQTSTTNYPNLLILDYLKESDQTKPEVEKRARELLARGYQKLTSFECPKSGAKERMGYEWFGSPDQAHEALTAYGLLQFRDMSRVQEVDPAMLQRTRNYLMAQRDGKGGFKRNARALDTFGRAPDNITNAYIVWAITESGKDDDVTTELNAVAEQAKTSKDPYFLALVANSLINRGQTADATDLLKKLAAAQNDDGHLDAERTSITGSGGRDLQVETTGLAVLAWLKGNPGEFNAPVQKAIKWIGQQRGGYGGFGSTQSTILALKALIAYTKANKKAPEAGTLTLFVGDKPVSKLDFPADAREALEIKLADGENILKAGKNTVRAEITGQNAFPYTLSWSYQTLKPASAEDCPVRLTTKLDRTTANEGETVSLNVAVENPSDAERSMVVAIVGLPAGLTIPEDMKQLKEHAQLRDNGTKPGRISYFETRGRELILYWRGMGPKQKLEVPVELVCRVPGEYRGPASRAYMYYNADYKHWVDPLAVTITPKE
jgi:hypothetical protein